ncbi:hypothetical protein [Prosthecobacter sp.]|uniref:hypothetical protein n=1 Tax=Prosthecobacter sp. TaxID=1965333 RepID=UPI003782D37F
MKHAKALIEDLQVRRRPALGRGLRELLLHGELSAAAERTRALRVPKPVNLPRGIPDFANPWARKVWLRSGKPL